MATLTQISQALNDLLPKLKPLSMPTGMLGHFYSVPDGWLLCNGAAVSRSTYAALFAVIGTNLANRFVEGTTSIGSVGTFKSAGLPNITGSAQISTRYPLATTNHTGALYGTALGSADTHGQDVGDRLFRALALSASRSNSTYGSSSTVQPPSMMLLPCIKL